MSLKLPPEIVQLIVDGVKVLAQKAWDKFSSDDDDAALAEIKRRAIQSQMIVEAAQMYIVLDDLGEGAVDVVKEWVEAEKRGAERIDEEARSRVQLTQIDPDE